MVNVPVRARRKGVVHTMMGKSTSLPAASAVKSRFMLITRVIGLYSSFTSLPTEHLPADRKSLPSPLHESPTQIFLDFSLSPVLFQTLSPSCMFAHVQYFTRSQLFRSVQKPSELHRQNCLNTMAVPQGMVPSEMQSFYLLID